MNNEAIIEFQWDKGNSDKNQKHKVRNEEAEQIFFDRNKVIAEDSTHSVKEKRYIIIGKTKGKRLLYTVYTLRGKYIRIISSRDINKKEVAYYEKAA